MSEQQKKEQRAWNTFRRSVKPRTVRAWRVENMVVAGMSDVININAKGTVFWVENKCIENWPARTATYPLRTAFEPGQLPFCREWKKWKGHAFVLLRVEKQYYLLNPDLPLDAMTKENLIRYALIEGKEKIIEFLEKL